MGTSCLGFRHSECKLDLSCQDETCPSNKLLNCRHVQVSAIRRKAIKTDRCVQERIPTSESAQYSVYLSIDLLTDNQVRTQASLSI